jgi:hypothetical protein
MPGLKTVMQWLARYPEFAQQYAQARQAGADALADEIIDIADNRELDPQDRRVRIDARKWIASKLKPKAYGEKTELTHDVGEGLASILAKLGGNHK